MQNAASIKLLEGGSHVYILHWLTYEHLASLFYVTSLYLKIQVYIYGMSLNAAHINNKLTKLYIC